MESKGFDLITYLNKRYYIKENLFFEKNTDEHVWGESILTKATKIFSYDGVFCLNIIAEWVAKYNLSSEEFRTALYPKTLKVTWNPEVAQGLAAYFGIYSSEEHMKNILIDAIGRELNSEILLANKEKIKTIDDMVSIIKCLGYEPSTTIYDAATYRPRRYFVSTTYNEMINERQNNTLWQDWF